MSLIFVETGDTAGIAETTGTLLICQFSSHF